MLFGSYKHNLDDKGRLSIPTKLRSSLTLKLYIMKGFEGCISIFNEEDFINLVNSFGCGFVVQLEVTNIFDPELGLTC